MIPRIVVKSCVGRGEGREKGCDGRREGTFVTSAVRRGGRYQNIPMKIAKGFKKIILACLNHASQ